MDPTILLQQRGGSNLMKTTKALFARGMHHLTEEAAGPRRLD